MTPPHPSPPHIAFDFLFVKSRGPQTTPMLLYHIFLNLSNDAPLVLSSYFDSPYLLLRQPPISYPLSPQAPRLSPQAPTSGLLPSGLLPSASASLPTYPQASLLPFVT